jgi:serine/threonine protein kinase
MHDPHSQLLRDSVKGPSVDLTGTLLGRQYRLVRLLGLGGMAETWLAEEESLGRPVVVKLPHATLLAHAETSARFQREGRAAARLLHPNIAAVFAVGDHEGRPYLVTEYVAGETLATQLAEGRRFSPTKVRSVLHQIGAALDALHGAGIVHRDLHTANVLTFVDTERTERVKLIDFGIARYEAASTAPLTAPDVVHGFRPFIAPERFRGAAGDARADVYAMGVIALSLLSGWQPTGVDFAVALSDVPASDRWAPGLREAVARALSPEPADRFPSAGDFAAAIGRALSPADLDAQSGSADDSAFHDDVPAGTIPHARDWMGSSPRPGSVGSIVLASTPVARRPRRRGPTVAALGAALSVVVALVIMRDGSRGVRASSPANTRPFTADSGRTSNDSLQRVAPDPAATRVAPAGESAGARRGASPTPASAPSFGLAPGEADSFPVAESERVPGVRDEGLRGVRDIAYGDAVARLDALLTRQDEGASLQGVRLADSLLAQRDLSSLTRASVLRLAAGHFAFLGDVRRSCESLAAIPVEYRIDAVRQFLASRCSPPS